MQGNNDSDISCLFKVLYIPSHCTATHRLVPSASLQESWSSCILNCSTYRRGMRMRMGMGIRIGIGIGIGMRRDKGGEKEKGRQRKG